MNSFAQQADRALCTLLCIAILAWCIGPSIPHVPAIGTAATALSVHGHSHGAADLGTDGITAAALQSGNLGADGDTGATVMDIYWAFHGHPRTMIDHDHSTALPFMPGGLAASPWASDMTAGAPGLLLPAHASRIERPPRG